jgi:hypothetical protein
MFMRVKLMFYPSGGASGSVRGSVSRREIRNKIMSKSKSAETQG